MKRVHS